jgi:predicted ATPase/DNA-binding SARP family transcriptional activator
MGLLRLTVLGSPEVFHDGSRLKFALRKAQALLLYLAVEGGMHPRSKLAAFLWPDSAPQDARTALRNAIALLRSLLADSDASPSQHSHLLSEHELLGLNPRAPLELDLDVVQQAYKQAQLHTTVPSPEQRASLVAHVQHAFSLVRGPFLDGFWLGEEAAFDEWHQMQQHQWQVRSQLLCDRLSSWQEEAGELEQAKATLIRWLALEPLAEEAAQRLMQVHLALGDATAALQVYATCRARLAEALQVEPSPETVALAELIRASAAARRRSPPARRAAAEHRPPGELVTPLIGRAAAFSQLVGSFQQARQGQPQVMLVMGEAGIGKTRLAREFVAWARAHGADVLSGHAFEMGGRLPYHPLVEAVRPRLEVENAPEDLLEDLWLAELSRLLPELRVRYPDLPDPTEDELTAKGRLFEAVARLLDALARPAPLVLLLDDLQWLDGASLDLVRYLGGYWKAHESRILLLGTVSSEGMEPKSQLATELSGLGRDLPVNQVTLLPLSQADIVQLVQSIAREEEHITWSGGEQREHGPAALVALGDFLFARTGGYPLYLLETLKLLQDRGLLVPRLGADDTWRLEPTGEMAAVVAQEWSRREFLPPSVRAMILARLGKLTPAARQLVRASAVLGNQASVELLWQVAELGAQAGVEALEEAVGSGILREEDTRTGRKGGYHFTHEMIRDVVYTELGEARRHLLHQRALVSLSSEGAPVSELAYHALLAGEAEAAYRYSVQAADEAVAVFAVEDAIGYYEQARALFQEQQRLQSVLLAPEVEHLYVRLARASAYQNSWQQAQEACEELLAYAQQHQLPALVSMTLNRLAILAVQQSKDKLQVRALLEEARRLAENSHDQRALAETEWNHAQIIAEVWGDPKHALPHVQKALELVRGIHDKELEARCLAMLGMIHLLGAAFEEALYSVETALALYAALSTEPLAVRELSLPSFMSGSPLTQPLTNRAIEAKCWAILAVVQQHAGHVQKSIRCGRQALALAHESRTGWAQIHTTICLTHGLLDAGAHEEALGLMQQAVGLARTLPATIHFQRFLIALGYIYHALQQWDEAKAALEEAEAMAERLDLGPLRVPALSRLCMHYALAGEWEAACHYAEKALALRTSNNAALILMDFYLHFETEALLRGGDELRAREEVQRLGERLGPYPRYRIPYLRSLAVLARWKGEKEQAIDHLREVADLAADLGLPAEQWQIQAELGMLYEAGGESAQACAAFGEAARILQGLAESIGDEALRSRFLAAPPIQQVMQYARSEACLVLAGHAEAN